MGVYGRTSSSSNKLSVNAIKNLNKIMLVLGYILLPVYLMTLLYLTVQQKHNKEFICMHNRNIVDCTTGEVLRVYIKIPTHQ